MNIGDDERKVRKEEKGVGETQIEGIDKKSKKSFKNGIKTVDKQKGI